MSSFVQSDTTLLCTLGGKPRIVTLTLDLLLARGEAIGQVLVVYPPANARYRAAYQRLLGEFAGDRYFGRPMRLRGVPVHLGERALHDAVLPAEVSAVWETFQQTIAALKAEHQQVHLSLSGGRRILALVAFSVAMAHFTSSDYVWHLHTPERVSRVLDADDLMHAPPGSDVRLISVPFTPWVSYFPGLQSLLTRFPDEQGALGALPDIDERARCQEVWQKLTRAQQEALRALCATNTRREAAERMGVSVGTLDDHKAVIFRHCRLVWQGERVDVRFLRRRFRGYLRWLDKV